MNGTTKPGTIATVAAAAAVACALAVFAAPRARAQEGGRAVNDTQGRRSRIIEGCIFGTHAWQVKLYRKSKKGTAS